MFRGEQTSCGIPDAWTQLLLTPVYEGGALFSKAHWTTLDGPNCLLPVLTKNSLKITAAFITEFTKSLFPQ